MLRRLQLENFKAWKKADMRLAPLTGLFGTNSSGKTSILQFLLMLKQTVESSDRALVLNLNGNYVELGTFFEIVTDNNPKNRITFSINWNQNLDKFYGMSIDIETKSIISQINNEIVPIHFSFYSNPDDSPNRVGSEIVFKRETSGNYKVTTISDDDGIAENEAQYRSKFYEFDTWDPKYRTNYEAKDVSYYINTFFNVFHYLGPLREYPKRNYTWGGERRSQLGNRGEFAIECILASRERGDKIEHKGETYSLETYLAMWLRELGMIQDFKIDSITEGGRLFEVRVRQTEKSPYVLLTDVGFGVSQILPVLTLCYYTPKGSILLMEQPEIHLHPRVQAGLADVFIDAIHKRGVQIILESHSEHLLRRLQLRIAQEKFSNDEAALYFCEVKQGYSELLDLQLDAFGNIKNWPDNFFGDEMTEVFQMSEAIAERKKKAKLNGE